jgi:hypothetical protein
MGEEGRMRRWFVAGPSDCLRKMGQFYVWEEGTHNREYTTEGCGEEGHYGKIAVKFDLAARVHPDG